MLQPSSTLSITLKVTKTMILLHSTNWIFPANSTSRLTILRALSILSTRHPPTRPRSYIHSLKFNFILPAARATLITKPRFAGRQASQITSELSEMKTTGPKRCFNSLTKPYSVARNVLLHFRMTSFSNFATTFFQPSSTNQDGSRAPRIALCVTQNSTLKTIFFAAPTHPCVRHEPKC